MANVNVEYNGNIDVYKDGRVVVNGDDIQSCVYLYTIYKALSQPIDSGLWVKGMMGECQSF